MAFDQLERFRAVAADLERRRPDLVGKPLAAVPELAALRYEFRRGFYRRANWNFAFAIFNFIVAAKLPTFLWPVNALAAGLSVWAVGLCERRARAMTRQLNRPAIEQIARDLMGWRD